MTSHSYKLSIEILTQIDALCDEYETQWASNPKPELESYLSQVPVNAQEQLFKSLVELELELNSQVALDVQKQGLEKRYPNRSDLISELVSQAVLLQEKRIKTSHQSAAKTEESDMQNDPAPEFIERFQILEVLGEGGFGMVYKALDPHLNRIVAIKVPLKSTLKSEENFSRFIREAQVAASLHHPGICPIYEVECEGELPHIVMKYIDGSTMDEIFKRKFANKRLMTISKSIQLILKIGSAVEYAHQKGVIHRDLKPSNIIWDKEHLTPVITDFGLARFWNKTDSDLTATGQAMGTPAFIAPEQARGIRKNPGRQVDVYSLGVIFYEILTGSRPFPGNSYDVVIQKTAEEPPAPSSFRSEIDMQLDAICLKTIAREPEQRYKTVQEFLDALKLYEIDENVSIPNSVSDNEIEEPQLKPISQNPLVAPISGRQQKPDGAKPQTTKPMKNSEDKIDPYYLWLGIPRKYRPPTYFQLLGISTRENDLKVIESCAARQLDHVQKYRGTEHESLAAQLTYEISEAKAVLSDANLRREYRENGFKHKKQRKKRYDNIKTQAGFAPRRIIGEDHQFVRTFLGVMSIILVCMLVAYGASFVFSQKATENPKATSVPRIPEQEVAEVENSEQEVTPIPESNPDVADPIKEEVSEISNDNPGIKSDSQSGFISLFDGHTLSGWSGRTSAWYPENGELRNRALKNQPLLVTEQEYEDFEFECDFYLKHKGQSGIFLRGRYELQLLDDPSYSSVKPIVKCGSIWNQIAPSESAYAGTEEWNKLKIRLVGKQVSVILNDVTVIDQKTITGGATSDTAHNHRVGEPGPIAIQSAEGKVRFRNLRLKPLNDSKSETEKTSTSVPANEFVALFDSQTLAGWHGDEKYWKVENGTIVGTIKQKTNKSVFLSSTETFDNFVLKVKYRLKDGNTGVQFRSQNLPDNSMSGYQADVAHYKKYSKWLGSLYGEKMGGMIYETTRSQKEELWKNAKMNQWNEYVITASGDHIKLELNGITTADLHHDGPKSGLIGFQLNGDFSTKVEFKDIMIKKLP